MGAGDVVFVRTTERRSYKTCRHAWWWSFIDELKAIRTKPALKFGDLSHQALGGWYIVGRKRGVHPAESFPRLYDEAMEAGMRDFGIRLDEDEEWVNARDLGITMMTGYVDRWGNDEHLKVLASELPFQVPLTDKNGKTLTVMDTDGRRKPVVYVGQFDILVQDLNTGQLGLVETKTAKSIRTNHLMLDEQAGSYWAFAGEFLRNTGLLKRGQDIDFILYNFLRKGSPDDRPINAKGQALNKPSKAVLQGKATELGLVIAKSAKVEEYVRALQLKGIDVTQLGEVSRSQPPPLFLRQPVYRDEPSRQNLLYRVRAEVYEMSLVKQGKLGVFKNPGKSWPDEHCNGCQFADMCELHENGGDWEELRDLTMTTWDPYEAHRDEIMEEA